MPADPVKAFIGGMIMLVTGVLLARGFREGGSLPSKWPFPPADRDNPNIFWASAFGLSCMFLVGLDMAVSGVFGTAALIVR